MSINETFGITVESVERELTALHAAFLAEQRRLNSHLRYLGDVAARQGCLFNIAVPDGTVAEVQRDMDKLKDENSSRKRHLNALLAVLKDEAKAVADQQQKELPLDTPPV